MSVSRYYETYWSAEGMYPKGQIHPELVRLFKKHIPAGVRCLDVGCGDGRTAGLWLQANGRDYVGVDISSNAIQDAQAAGLNASQIEDATSLPFESDSFDAVVCLEVMEHLFEPLKAAQEILRVLRPGGVAIITVPNVTYWRRRAEMIIGRWNPLGDDKAVEQPWRDPHIRFFSPFLMGKMLEAAGYERVQAGAGGGSLIRDLPFIGPRFYRGKQSPLYRRAEARYPNLLGYRVCAIAYKPQTNA